MRQNSIQASKGGERDRKVMFYNYAVPILHFHIISFVQSFTTVSDIIAVSYFIK